MISHSPGNGSRPGTTQPTVTGNWPAFPDWCGWPQATAATAPFPVIRDAPWLDQRRVSHRKPSLWPGVRHWAFVLAAMTAVTVALYAAERAAWPPSSPASPRLGRAWMSGSLLWLAATVPALCELPACSCTGTRGILPGLRPSPTW